MPDASTLGLFALASLALLVVPGPTVLYILARSVEGGARAGLASAAGAHVGTLVHVAAAALGVSALVVSSATAYSVVKYAGAAYLVFLGVRRLLERRTLDWARPAEVPGRSLRGLLFHGAVVNVLNPKTALFFLAFLPQFVDVEAGGVALQVMVLGLVVIMLGLLTDGAYALLAGTLAGRLRQSRRALSAERYVSASVFVGLGATAALSGEHSRAAAPVR
jgi:threonine/homoserine/homoserine lactone efflux protein